MNNRFGRIVKIEFHDYSFIFVENNIFHFVWSCCAPPFWLKSLNLPKCKSHWSFIVVDSVFKIVAASVLYHQSCRRKRLGFKTSCQIGSLFELTRLNTSFWEDVSLYKLFALLSSCLILLPRIFCSVHCLFWVRIQCFVWNQK